MTLVQGHSDSTFSNFFFLGTARLIETKFQMEPPWDGETKKCSNGPGHLTNMVDIPIYGKNLKKSFSGTERLLTLKVGMQHWALEYFQICSNDDPGLTLTYFTARSNLVPYTSIYGCARDAPSANQEVGKLYESNESL